MAQAGKQRGERLRAIADASPQIRASSDRAGRFLSLASLVSVLLSAIAVAMAAQRYARRHLDNVALMKCMGAPQRFVLTQTVVQLVAIAVVTAVAGTAIGYLAQSGIAWLLRDLLRGDLPPPSADAFLPGPRHGGRRARRVRIAAVAAPEACSARPCPAPRSRAAAAAVHRRLRPGDRCRARAAVLDRARRAARRLRGRRSWRDVPAARRRRLGAGEVLAPLRSGVGVAWRYGLANIARRGRDSIVQIVAFGLGFMVLLLLALVRNDLLRDWRRSLPTDAPNYFMINIRPTKARPCGRSLPSRTCRRRSWCRCCGRGSRAINGTPVEQDHVPVGAREGVRRARGQPHLVSRARARQQDRRRAVVRRTRDGAPRVSVEQDYAERLGIKLGDTLTYDVAGETVTARVTSLREVHWDSFQPNFFVVFSPGVLDDVAGTLITSVHVEPAQRPALVELVSAFPK
ncbi:MAG: hypothetical protein IPF50_15835 [Proteobacteria bacterium]|nr:hypothetical protein [Pseudomonadota bacterium]